MVEPAISATCVSPTEESAATDSQELGEEEDTPINEDSSVGLSRTDVLTQTFGGLLPELRWRAWKQAVRLHLGKEQLQSPVNYESMCACENQWSSQIRLDTPRTFPEVEAFGPRQEESLFRIMNAYANHNPEVGYCQGMNFVGGLLLLLSDASCEEGSSEEDAFAVLVGLMDGYGLAGFYKQTFPLLLKYVRACERLMSEICPALRKHLEDEGMYSCMYLHEWLLTVFINSLPFPIVFAIWDVIVREGLSILVSVVISIMEALKDTIISMRFENVHGLFKALKHCDEESSMLSAFQFDRLVQRAYYVEIPSHIIACLSDDADINEESLKDNSSELAAIGWRQSISRVLATLSPKKKRRGSEAGFARVATPCGGKECDPEPSSPSRRNRVCSHRHSAGSTASSHSLRPPGALVPSSDGVSGGQNALAVVDKLDGNETPLLLPASAWDRGCASPTWSPIAPRHGDLVTKDSARFLLEVAERCSQSPTRRGCPKSPALRTQQCPSSPTRRMSRISARPQS